MIYHVTCYGADNAGDIAIIDAVRRLLLTIDEDIRPVVDHSRQPKFDAPVFVGGGGLLISDSYLNSTSDWRWNISTGELMAIQQPIIVFAIGNNRFRRQVDFSQRFKAHLRLLADKSVFFGIRERSSIEGLRSYIGDFVDKVVWQPCPASLMGKWYGDSDGGDYTVFTPAMDRANLRGPIDRILPVLRNIPNLKVAIHMNYDKRFLKYIDFDCEVVMLSNKPTEEIVNFYKGAKQVIGMRLHSCLIPFGLGVSVIPLISHDKLVNWLIDIGHPEWGVELLQAEDVAEHIDVNQTDLAMRDKMYRITMKNIDEIKKVLA